MNFWGKIVAKFASPPIRRGGSEELKPEDLIEQAANRKTIIARTIKGRGVTRIN